MLTATPEQLGGTASKLTLMWNEAALSRRAALDLCRDSRQFRSQFIELLAASSDEAFFWEMPPITVSSLDLPFEFVLTSAPSLAKAAPNATAFQKQFSSGKARDGVVVFENLSGDATLVVPCPLAQSSAYTHFASFLRTAPSPQAHALLERLATEVLARVSKIPLWISTAGLGVYWLHIRLDSRPKYYRHIPYTQG